MLRRPRARVKLGKVGYGFIKESQGGLTRVVKRAAKRRMRY